MATCWNASATRLYHPAIQQARRLNKRRAFVLHPQSSAAENWESARDPICWSGQSRHVPFICSRAIVFSQTNPAKI
jgi:hypothetical protein